MKFRGQVGPGDAVIGLNSGQAAKTLGGDEVVERYLREFTNQFFSNHLLPEDKFLFLDL